MDLKITIDRTKLDVKLSQAKALAKQAMPQVYQKFVDVTPIKTGNAKSKTRLVGNKIEAKYPYASVLNDGRSFRDGQMRGSDQAPNGMLEPTKAFAERLLKSMAQKIGK